MQQVMDRGAKRRTVAATKMNQESSRSHGIFIISIECADVAILDADGKPLVKVGRLNLVDLAGSERQSKTDASGKQLVEAGNINKSLSTLGEVINKLTRKNPEFIPHRNSKLTRLLQDSLGGNSRTVMIANIGPAEYNYEETSSTLRYANRAKQIKNNPVVNCAQDAMVLKMQEEIAKLKKMLEERNTEKIVVADEEIIKKLQIEMEEKAKEKESALESEKERLEEERKKIEQELRRREEEAAKERAEREIAARKLKHMEEKVIKGGTHLQDMQAKHKRQMEEMKRKMEEQKKEEERKRVEMEKAKERELEEERKRLLADKETLEIDLRRTHQSLEEEVAHKNKQLEKILQSHKEARRQVQVMDEEMNQLKQQAEDEIKRLEDENEELQTEFEMERNMMIDSIAEPQTQMKRRRRSSSCSSRRTKWIRSGSVRCGARRTRCGTSKAQSTQETRCVPSECRRRDVDAGACSILIRLSLFFLQSTGWLQLLRRLHPPRHSSQHLQAMGHKGKRALRWEAPDGRRLLVEHLAQVHLQWHPHSAMLLQLHRQLLLRT